uniref:Receptor kinase-like protein Xa21 n=1 Tax=Oryza meridionalis TaxID=40149 RepID=A0A0E0F317_9ORYZ
MKVMPIGLLLLVLIAWSSEAVICNSLNESEIDRRSLLEFKKGISMDPQKALMSWNDSTLLCNWEGVLCRVKTPRRVTSLNLTNRGLVGKISPSLGNLTFLKFLLLPTNSLTGEIPSSFGYLHRLQFLYLSNNTLQEMIPDLTNCSNLKAIWLDSNDLVGQIPNILPPHLQQLQLYNNNLTGTIPSYLANITSLKELIFVSNQIEGNIPNEFAKLPNLKVLYAGVNKLEGDFPFGIANLPGLTMLGLEDNKFTGIVPEWLGSLQNLQGIELANNFFTGVIPSSLANISMLEELFLESNQLYGHIPSSLGKLNVLSVLSISNNSLHGSIPEEIFRIPTIRKISLSFNNLDAPLHDDIGKAKQLTYLQLSSNNITGYIPSTLGNCESLEDIELDHNVFSGSIPTTLGNIKTLKVLKLSNNNLTGSIPASVGNLQLLEQLDLSFNNLKGEVPTKGIFKNATAMRVDGNEGLCGGSLELHLLTCSNKPLDSVKHKQSILLKVVLPMTIMVSLVAVISIMWFCKRKHKRQSISSPSFGRKFPKVSYHDLVRATEGFSTSNLIGRGRYGSVYQGKLFEGRDVVAVKVFNLETRGAGKSFIAECNALKNVRHRNLVTILTACSSIDSAGNDFKALLYEFMPQGDLHNLLYSTRDGDGSSNLRNVSLAQRLSIAVDVSDALAYLHHNHQGTIVHSDIKPSNILLNDDMMAHVGDFGLARFRSDSATSSFVNSNSTSSIAIKGTIGYVAPECAEDGQVSTASDVYSFGIVLLEIFIRKKPTDDMFKDGLSIVKYTEINLPEKMLQIVDPQLLQELHICHETPTDVEKNEVNCLLSVLNIGLNCTRLVPSERMSMQEVASKLHGIRDEYLRGD